MVEPRNTGETQRPETGQEALEEQNLIRGRKRRRREDHMEAGELNIVPYLDIVTNLVMFLLQVTTSAVALGEIQSRLPVMDSAGPSQPEPPKKDEKPPLKLTVVIGEKGFTIAGAEAVLPSTAAGAEAGPTLPKINNEYDYVGLTKLLVNIKKAFPEEKNAFIVPEDRVQYQHLVSTMDAMRENGPDPLFPDVMFAGF